MYLKDRAWQSALKRAREHNAVEDQLALEYFGVPFDELNEYQKEEIVFDAADIFAEAE